MLGISVIRSGVNSPLYEGLHRPWYCGTCKALHRFYGAHTRFLLHFDIVLLGEILHAVSKRGNPTHWNNGVCLDVPTEEHFSPLHRFLADIHLVFLHIKLQDHHHDEAFYPAKWTEMPFRKAIIKAMRNLELQGLPPQLWENYLKKQWHVESLSLPVTEYAKPTEELCESIIVAGARIAGIENHIPKLRILGRAFGLFLYLSDAYRDLQSDIRKKRFNAFSHSRNNLRSHDEIRRLLQSAFNRYNNALRHLPLKPELKTYFQNRLRSTLEKYLDPARSSCNLASPKPQHNTKNQRLIRHIAAACILFILSTLGFELSASSDLWVIREKYTLSSNGQIDNTILYLLGSLYLVLVIFTGFKFRLFRRFFQEMKAGYLSFVKNRGPDDNENNRSILKKFLWFLLWMFLIVLALLLFYLAWIFYFCFINDPNQPCQCNSDVRCSDSGGQSGGSCCN